MIILGIILLLLGFGLQLGILETIGLILLAVGLILWLLGVGGHPVAGRSHWF